MIAAAQQASSSETFILLSTILTGWGVVAVGAIGLYWQWRKSQRQKDSDQRLIREEVLGREAKNGLAAKPALSDRLDKLQDTLESAMAEMSNVRRRVHRLEEAAK